MSRKFTRLIFLCFLPAAAVAAPAPSGRPAAVPPEHTGEGDTIHIPPKIEWEKIAELPPRHGEAKNPGLAGVFAGAHGDVFLIAGGTNYPQGRPWTGAARAVYSDIYVLQRKPRADGLPDHLQAGFPLEGEVHLEVGLSHPGGRLVKEPGLRRRHGLTRGRHRAEDFFVISVNRFVVIND